MSMKKFQVIKKLGEGSFGVVQKVRRLQDNQQYALKKVKYMDLKQKSKKNALNQIRILASIDHPNIIKYKQAFFQQNSKMLCTVMELAPNGDLSGRIKQKTKSNTNFPEYQIWSIGKDIVNGIFALHQKNILHRDIKPANIFFCQGDVAKIGDLNVSFLVKEGLAYTQTGTPYYASPQVWDNQPYAFQCDVWSFGCVLYQMCCLKKPFQANSMEKLYQKIKKSKYDPIPCRFSSDLTYAIQKCLTSKRKRISLQQLKRIFDLHNAPKVLQNSNKNQNEKLMETIKVPINKRDFQLCLPKSKYINSQQNSQKKVKLINGQNNWMGYKVQNSKNKSQSNKSYINISRSQKYIKTPQRPSSGIQIPSFKQIISMFSPRKQQIKDLNSINRLKLKKRRILITQAQ